MKFKLTKLLGFVGIASMAISSLLLVIRDAYIQNVSFDHTLIPWFGAGLYQLQRFGFLVASMFFPCQKEGFDVGCESFKVVPTIILTNSFIYALILIPLVHAWRVLKHGLKQQKPDGAV